MRHHIKALAVPVLMLGLGVSACTDLSATAVGPSTVRISAPGVPIAVESITGAPGAVAPGFNAAFVEAANARQIELVGGKANARYRIKGYLSAEPTEDGKTELAFVWDVFDSAKQRAQRLTGATLARAGSGGDPWSGVDQGVMTRAASDSMDVIAGFLRDSGAVSAAAASDAKPGGAVSRAKTAQKAGSAAL
jgi:hypothetical protein